MSKVKFAGPFSLRLKSFVALNRIAIATYFRHALGDRLAPDWGANLEIGIRFVRHQFTTAMAEQNMEKGRLLFDSLQLETDDHYNIRVEPSVDPKGHWYYPTHCRRETTLLYLHGGGYAFHGGVSARFAAMLAHHSGAAVFAPDYRLTPEHPHPAQADDALAAWRYLSEQTPPEKIVVIGDSAGGHMSLMLLQTLKDKGLVQPALCIGLCPWADIGDRGASLHENDKYDLVQGWMALKFGKWLDPEGKFDREALSPIFHDFTGLAPIYLQAGGREILRDMIKEFAEIQKSLGAEVTFDLWADMPHVFQAYDSYTASSTEALSKIVDAIDTRLHALSETDIGCAVEYLQ